MTSIIILILVNLVPLFGVLFFQWDLFTILLLYWLENGVIGISNALRMITSQGKLKIVPEDQLTLKQKYDQDQRMKVGNVVYKWMLTPFFLIHYGIFFLVHGLFVFVIFGRDSNVDFLGLAFSLALIIVNHGYSFAVNYIGKKEYLKVSVDELFIQPYKRVVIIHLTIIFGAFIALSTNMNVFVIVVMIIIKTVVDILAHKSEHKTFQSKVVD